MAARSGYAAADRSRRMRDAVDAVLTDVILPGTEQQFRLAARAAMELVAARSVHTAELVISLHNFVRRVLDLEAAPPDAESRLTTTSDRIPENIGPFPPIIKWTENRP